MTQNKPILTPDDLIQAGLVAPQERASLDRLARESVIRITPAMAELIDPNDPADPIGLQYVPQAAELSTHPAERDDPIGDHHYSPMPGLVHRYPDRVLIKPIMVCPVYCRFCFRRDQVGQPEATLGPDQIRDILDYIKARPAIREVILTGGDPLMLGARRLAQWMDRLAELDQLDVIRLHSRVPVADPGRVDGDVIAALGQSPKAVWLSIHVNHPRELTASADQVLARLAGAGVVLIAQTVLLKGVNDDERVLEDLMRALVRRRVRPYYLHHPDLVPGTSHLRVDVERGQALMRALRGRLSGIAQPVYVLDIPGGAGKVPIGPVWLDLNSQTVTDPQGESHAYAACVALGVPTC